MPDWTARLRRKATKTIILKAVAWRCVSGALRAGNETVGEELTSPGVEGMRLKTRGAVPVPVVLHMVVPTPPLQTKPLSYTESGLSYVRNSIVLATLYDKPNGTAIYGFNENEFFLTDYAVVSRSPRYHGFGSVANSTSTVIVQVTLKWTGATEF